jgi:hypothetical protein
MLHPAKSQANFRLVVRQVLIHDHVSAAQENLGRGIEKNRGALRPDEHSPQVSQAMMPSADEDRMMKLQDAITAHVNWKLRIHALLTGKLADKLDPAAIARDNVCDLGKWIWGEGKNEIPQATLAELRATHAEFHREAARIVSEVYSGHTIGLEAIDPNTPFGKLTTKIVGILSKLKTL